LRGAERQKARQDTAVFAASSRRANKEIVMKTLVTTALALTAIVGATAGLAQDRPVQNINPYRHGNLAAAQSLTSQAFDRLTEAQIDNDYDLGGHVGHAKELLREANEEIKMAAQFANHH
jgi:hypothetical protein